MWEPRTGLMERDRAPMPDSSRVVLSGGFSEPFEPGETTDASSQINIPSELLILNRFGVGYPFLRAAAQISSKYHVDGREVLLRANVISEEIWLESQHLLDIERRKKRDRLRSEELLLDQAINNLRRTLPEYSAKNTFTLPQAFGFTAVGFLALIFSFFGNNGFLIAVLLVASAFYTAVSFMRVFMLAWYDQRVTGTQLAVSVSDSDLPIYTLLVPLFEESNQVNELTSHLATINWPKDKLDIKLICESDDLETIEAANDANLPDYFSIVIVPAASPKTKPKALNYALPNSIGEFLVIYDAEDRPHPNQLREAYSRFLNESADLACLQAPLLVRNNDNNLITRMFFIEYITLFKGILPVLATWRLPLPLGGTSNHFKTKILKQIGGWDPYNVTEDADLGIRLFREGYRSSTISLPTLEEAPPDFWPWIKQRTRWIKGWMQTILVHNRNPIHLFVDLGLRNCAGFHLMLTSIVISSLIHPIFLSLSLYELFIASGQSAIDHWVLGIGIFNLVAGYTTYGLFALLVLKRHGHGNFASQLIFMPFYWLMISVAGWRALIHLMIKPHRWEKTPHGLGDQPH